LPECAGYELRRARNSDQKVETNPATFTMVWPQEGLAAAGGGTLRRQDARPATKVAVADAKLLMVRA
jgi:hypothetical protein